MVTLIVGGARSGKSTLAESYYKDKTDVVYIATSRGEDEEMKQRIKHHKLSRPNYWRTYEGSYDLENAIGDERYYLLDCITVLASNIMFDMSKDEKIIDHILQKAIEDKVIDVIKKLVKQINDLSLTLVLVTNEVGWSLVSENHISRVYTDILGRVNQRIAEISHEVFAVICGIPLKLK